VDSPNAPDEQPAAALTRLVNGYQVSQAIHVAATLGIADLLREGSRSAADIAAATGTHEGTLYRLLRALASVGVFREEPGHRFALTPLGACLRSDAAEPVGPWAVMIGEAYDWQAWGQLLHSVRTGENTFRALHGMGVWQYREGQPEANARFDRAMTGNSRRIAVAALAAYDFSRFACVVDVAGGQGAFLAALLSRYPSMRGVLFDQAHVVAGCAEVLATAGVADRCGVVGGSFFEAVPEGGDAYVLKAILHDWEDEEATAILRACHGPGGHVAGPRAGSGRAERRTRDEVHGPDYAGAAGGAGAHARGVRCPVLRLRAAVGERHANQCRRERRRDCPRQLGTCRAPAFVCVESTVRCCRCRRCPRRWLGRSARQLPAVLTANIRTLPLPLAQIEATAAQARRAASRKKL